MVDTLETPCTYDLNLTYESREKRESQESKSCIPIISDNQTYYTMTINEDAIDEHWVETDDEKQLFFDDTPYQEVTLPWSFPYYGHEISHIFISRAGLVSMSPVPEDNRPVDFMAPFFVKVTSYTSAVFFDTKEDKFIIEWRDVYIRELSEDSVTGGPCQFQVIGLKDGTIRSLYKKLPTGIIDNRFFIGIHGAVTLSLPEKARVLFQHLKISHEDIHEGTVLNFALKPYCVMANKSQLCKTNDIDFFCKHCHFSKHCTFSTDRLVSEWLYHHCSDKIPDRCNISVSENNSVPISGDDGISRHEDKQTAALKDDTISDPEHHGISIPEDKRIADPADDRIAGPANNNASGPGDQRRSSTPMLIVLMIVATLVLMIFVGGGCYYVYSHTTTSSGRWCINHRPSRWMSFCLNQNGKSTTEDLVDSIPRNGDEIHDY